MQNKELSIVRVTLILIYLFILSNSALTDEYPVFMNRRIIPLNEQIERCIVNDHHIITKSGSSDIYNIYNISSYTHYMRILFSENPFNTSSIQYNNYDKQRMFMLTQSNKVLQYSLIDPKQTYYTNYINLSNSNYHDMKSTAKQVIVKSNNYIIERYQLLYSGTSKKIQTISINKGINNSKIKICQRSQNHFILVSWFSYCYLQIFQCQFNISSVSKHYQKNSNCDWNDQNTLPFKDIQFDQNCQLLIYFWKGSDPIILNLINYQTQLSLTNFNDSRRIFFLDSFNLFIGRLTTLNTIQAYRYNQTILYNNYISSFNIPIFYSILRYNKFNMKLFFTNKSNNQINVYDFTCGINKIMNRQTGLCEGCEINCQICNLTNLRCTLCKQAYQLDQLFICKVKTNQTTNENNSTSNENNSTNQTILLNQINRTNPLFIKPISQIQKKILNIMSRSLKFLKKISQKIISLFKVLPISIFFMRFINYWGICSYYMLLHVKIPEQLGNTLYQIYRSLNYSIFNQLKINIFIPTNLQEKISEEFKQKYGFSSDFINNNLENFIILLFCYLLLLFIYLVQINLSSKSFIKRYLSSIDYALIMLTQYCSIMGYLYVNLSIIHSKSYQNCLNQKINLVLHNFFIIFSTLTPFFCMIFIKQQSKIFQENLFHKLKYFYDCMCNCLIPSLIILGHLPLFFFISLFFYLLSMYLAFKQKEFKLNKIIHSSYLIFFHIGYILMNYIDNNKFQQIYHIISMITFIFIFLGAIHQLITLFCSILYDLRIFLLKLFKKKNRIEDFFKKQLNYNLYSKRIKSHNKSRLKNKINKQITIVMINDNKTKKFQNQKSIKIKSIANKINKSLNILNSLNRKKNMNEDYNIFYKYNKKDQIQQNKQAFKQKTTVFQIKKQLKLFNNQNFTNNQLIFEQKQINKLNKNRFRSKKYINSTSSKQ